MKLSLDIEADDEITPWLARVARGLQDGRNMNGVNGFVARSVAEGVKEYGRTMALTKHATADRLGGTRTGHLEQGFEAVTARPSEEGIVVDIPIPGIRRAFQDVTITPLTSKWLTLSATGEAYGRRARSFSGLRMAFFRNDLAALVRPGAKGERDEVMYWLKKSVFQRQDRTLLPSDVALLQMAEDGAEDYLDHQESINERATT